MQSNYAHIAMNRFACGTDAKSYAALKQTSTLNQSQNWLLSQLNVYTLPTSDWSSAKAIEGYYYYKTQQKVAEKKISDRKVDTKTGNNQPNEMRTENQMQIEQAKNIRRRLVEASRNMAQQTALAHFNSVQPIQAKLLDFFSNHFSVSRTNTQMNLLAPTLEYEAIAPNLQNKFGDMLVAVTKHPAMLMYLNNERSIGPNSKLGRRRKKRNPDKSIGLNENLGREILELHTLGVNAPYTQADVIELSKALTGWSIGSPRKNEQAGFIFRSATHEPGIKKVMDKQYPSEKPNEQEKQATKMLQDLAKNAHTAKHISYKLAKHFIADEPPKILVQAMTKSWLASGGSIPKVMRTLIEHPLSWSKSAQKLKTPREFIVSACRACGVKMPSPSLYQTLEILGQGFFNAGSPAGYADHRQAWLGTSAMNSRIEWASHFASVTAKKIKLESPVKLAQFALGPMLSNDTLQAIKRADSKQQAFTLLFMSPEFQRR